ncbi:MAG TPA: FMN-binding protein [Candidatus Nitrosocosmicus sp.]|nr:FMN-binding protein [Candidatus Nitrosocosmicus sp.]
MKLLLKIVLSVVILIVLVLGGGMFFISRGVEAGEALEINEVNLSEISDGTYNGIYNSGRWTNEVSVKVKEHKIIGVEIVKDVLLPKPEVTAELINLVLEKQSPKIDAISGSTVTCKAYLKSIENALK